MKKIFTLIAMAAMAMGAQAQLTWNFSKYESQVDLYGNNATITYDGLTIVGDASKTKAGNEYVSASTGFRVNGTSSATTRFISFRTKTAGTLTVTYRSNNGTRETDVWAVATAITTFTKDATVPATVAGWGSTEGSTLKTFTAELNASTTYYIFSANGGGRVSQIEYTGTLAAEGELSDAKVWDFTAGPTGNDLTNLQADAANWELTTDGYWQTKATAAARNVFYAPKANDADIEYVKGIEFTRDNSAGLESGRFRLYVASGDGDKGSVYLNGSNVILKVVGLLKGDVLKVYLKGGGNNDRTLTVSNTDVAEIASELGTEGEGESAKTVAKEMTKELKVAANGDVTFKSSNGFYFYAIALNDNLPTAIQDIKNVKVANDGDIYNLAGQKVSNGFKGIAIQNGRKVVIK